jgi:hypothetical protein
MKTKFRRKIMLNFNYKLFVSRFLFFALIVCGANSAFAQTTKPGAIQLTIPETTEFTFTPDNYAFTLLEDREDVNFTAVGIQP